MSEGEAVEVTPEELLAMQQEAETEARAKETKKTIIAVKKWNVKGGRRYGPYPKAPDEYYLYEQTWDRKKARPLMRYLGRGKKPPEAVVKEVEGVISFLKEGERPSPES